MLELSKMAEIGVQLVYLTAILPPQWGAQGRHAHAEGLHHEDECGILSARV